MKESELALQDISGKIAQNERRLYSGKVRNPKELQGLQRETTHLKQRRSAKEEEVLEAMVHVDELARDYEKARQHLQAVDSAWKEAQAELTTEEEALVSRLNALQERSRQIVATLPHQTVGIYEHTKMESRSRRGLAERWRMPGMPGVCIGEQGAGSARKHCCGYVWKLRPNTGQQGPVAFENFRQSMAFLQDSRIMV
ncbi:MAG: hypothetical protein GXP41_10525 [Chloroflexi bacterium]|nr:hypothetical protein [Chloroflexota bacterium]